MCTNKLSIPKLIIDGEPHEIVPSHDIDGRLEKLKKKPSDAEYVYECMKGFLIHYINITMVERKINITDLAKKMGCTKNYVTRILNKTTYTIEKIAEIACALEMDVGFGLKKMMDEDFHNPTTDG